MDNDILTVKQNLGIVGNSQPLLQAISAALQAAPFDVNVLIVGENGVGKEVFHKILHNYSARKHSKCIPVNCGALPEGTINSELFGHVKGAFTGAIADRKGYFEEADGGRIAFASADYLQMLYYELTTTRLSQYISLKDGKISGINGCTVKELGSEHLPAGGAFVILSSDMVKALNALEAAGQLDDETALEQILTENPEGIYFHGEQPWLRTLDVDVEQGDTGKIIVTINTAKTDTYQSPGVTSTGHWLFGAADTSEKLPTPVYGTSCDISTSSSSNGWYGCIPLDPTQVTAQGKYTILGDNKFEIDVSALTNASYGGIPNSSGSTTPSALKYFEIVEVFRTMKPAGRRIKPLDAGL